MFLTPTNGQQNSITATNNRSVPLITLFPIVCQEKIHVLKAVLVKYKYDIY